MTAKKGFVLIEILIVLMIIALLAANMIVPVVLRNRQTAEEVVCQQARRQIQDAELFYFTDLKRHSQSLQDLADAGYLLKIPICPNQGIFAWMPYPQEDPRYQSVLGCSIHTRPESLTSLGSTFEEITYGFIDLLRKYFVENGQYPGSGWQRTLRDLGLDVDEWRNGINGIVYRPNGATLRIQPDSGYVFQVQRALGGNAITVQPHQRLIYSVEQGKWYFQRLNPGSEVHIGTLIVQGL